MPTDLRAELKKYFGYDNFRNGQEEIIRSVLECNDTLVVMPTGGGKSLCYQLPALVMPGTALVISPLIALMKDQVDALQKAGRPATFINSSLQQHEIESRLHDARLGKYKLIYIAPERLESKRFIAHLKQVKISFLAIDEAHCISEWGHDFRPSYLNISEALSELPKFPVIALTATATPEVRHDIVTSLEIPGAKKFIRGFDRPNLSYITEDTSNKIARAADLINETRTGSTIIYCGSRKRVEEFTSSLREMGIKADGYHAGMAPAVRDNVQNRFINDSSKIIVATNAFGMGIDKPDVRNVIHNDMTQTLEAYYQEAGRAGRDGKESRCYYLFDVGDIFLQEFFINSTYPSEKDIRKVYDELTRYTSSSGKINNFVTADFANEIGLAIRTTASILKLLEREKVIFVQRGSTNPKIRIISERERIKDYIENGGKKAEFLETLLRSVSVDAFRKTVELDLSKMRRKYAVNSETAIDGLRQLAFSQIIEYTPGVNSGGGYTLELSGEKFEELPVDLEALKIRRDRALAKLDVMIEYAETDMCKRNFILAYFGDDSVKGKCGRCSACLGQKKKSKIETSKSKFLKQNIINVVGEYDGKFPGSVITDVIAGKKSKAVKAFSLDELSEFGSGKEFSSSQIKDEIKGLRAKRYLKINDDDYKTLSLNELGKIKTNRIPENGSIMEKFDSNTVFNKLVALRRDIAERAGVVPRGIISDVALRKISEQQPKTEEEMKNISGISQIFVQKFAKLFLSEIDKIKDNPKEQKFSKVAKDTLKLAKQGLTLERIAQRMFANENMASNYIVEVIEGGGAIEVDLTQFVDEEDYLKVKKFIKENPKRHSGKFARIYPESMTSPNLSKGEAVFRTHP
jgi:ATP-dependent DNA helicase RecQ